MIAQLILPSPLNFPSLNIHIASDSCLPTTPSHLLPIPPHVSSTALQFEILTNKLISNYKLWVGPKFEVTALKLREDSASAIACTPLTWAYVLDYRFKILIIRVTRIT